MGDSRMKIGFIGCGRWAQKKYLPYLAERNDVQVVAVSNSIGEEDHFLICRIFPSIQFFNSYEEMLSTMELDGVIVSLPHAMQFLATKHTLTKKIPTFVDKPLSTDYTKAKELVDMATEAGISLVASSQRRVQNGYSEIIKLIKQGDLGLPLWIHSEFIHGNGTNWENNWRRNIELTDGRGALLDTGYHLVDIVSQLLNGEAPIKIHVESSNRDCKIDMDTIATLVFPQGTRAHIFVSRNMPVGYDIERLSILCSTGYAIIEVSEINGIKESKCFYSVKGENFSLTKISDETKLYPLRDFIAHLQGEPLPELWKAHTVLPTLKLIDMIYSAI